MLPEYGIAGACVSFVVFIAMAVYEFLVMKRKLSKFNVMYLAMEVLHLTFFLLNFAKTAYNLPDIVQIISNICIASILSMYIAYLYLRTSSMFFGNKVRARVVKVLSYIAWLFFWLAFVPYFVFANDFKTGDLFFNLSTLTGGFALICLDIFYVYCFYSFLNSTHDVLHKGSRTTEMTIIGRYGMITSLLSATMFFTFIANVIINNEAFNLFVQLLATTIIVSLFLMKVKVDRFQEKRRKSQNSKSSAPSHIHQNDTKRLTHAPVSITSQNNKADG
jgi:hypothetical protein